MNENKKGVKAKKHRVAHIEPSKPRNFVAKNAMKTTSGAGAHKDKKKAMKQGDVKHKKAEYAEHLEQALAKKLLERKVDEILPVVGAVAGRLAAGAAGAGRLATTAATAAGRAVGQALDSDDDANEEFDSPEYNDEAGMAHTNLTTLARAVDGLTKAIEEGDNLPEWCQEKIAKAEQMLVGVWDYILSQKEQGIDPEVKESSLQTEIDGYPYLSSIKKPSWFDPNNLAGLKRLQGQLEWKMNSGEASQEERNAYFELLKLIKLKQYNAAEGWTHDTLAARLFETENTYEDKLRNMLIKKMSRN